MKLSQQGLADLMEIKRGKVAGYFYETQPKPDFYKKLSEKLRFNVGEFLTVEMNDENYESFFSEVKPNVNIPNDTSAIDLLLKARTVDDKRELVSLLDEAMIIFGNIMNENSQLKDQLIDMLKKNR